MSDKPAVSGFSVRAKLISLVVGTSVLALLVACASFVMYDRSSYAEAKQRTLSVLVASVAQSAFGPTAFQDQESAKVILNVLDAEASAKGGAIYGEDGAALASWGRAGYAKNLPKKWEKSHDRHGYLNGELHLTHAIANADQNVGTLHVVFSTDDLEARTRRFVQLAGIVLAFSAVAALILAMFAQRVLTRPVSILAAAAHRVEVERDFDVRAERVSNDELGRLTDAFNAMLTMIQARDGELASHRAGLEELVAERTRDLDERNREMRLVLDNVDQGMVILARDGTISGERSRSFDQWFGEPTPGETLTGHFSHTQPKLAADLAMSWDQLIEDFLPMELNLAQLPQQLETASGAHYELAYRPIVGGPHNFEKMLVVVSDVTARIAREKSDAAQAETLSMFEHITADRSGFQEFFEETQAMMARLCSPTPRDVTLVLRELHTLKGNFGLFGLRTMTTLIHAIEDECLAERTLLDDEQRARLRVRWDALSARARNFLGEGARALTIDMAELHELTAAIKAHAPQAELLRLATRLGLEPVAPKLWRLGERARRLAERLGKGAVRVEVEADGVKGSSDLGWLWQVLPHVAANAVDHGIDSEDTRRGQGKVGAGTLRLSAYEQHGALVIEIADDGRGIDWETLRRRAVTLGMASNTNDDVQQALFADGVSTRDVASEVSGRGIGLAAVKAACAAHGARVTVSSAPDQGTAFRFELREQAALGRTVSIARLSLVSA